ncbi:MAG: hypothetical protein HON32_09295 [Francisellaceae bacterium]|jgi:hypothetical protein|nr:hypothetical protein [Francisellaceae bacterium]
MKGIRNLLNRFSNKKAAAVAEAEEKLEEILMQNLPSVYERKDKIDIGEIEKELFNIAENLYDNIESMGPDAPELEAANIQLKLDIAYMNFNTIDRSIIRLEKAHDTGMDLICLNNIKETMNTIGTLFPVNNDDDMDLNARLAMGNLDTVIEVLTANMNALGDGFDEERAIVRDCLDNLNNVQKNLSKHQDQKELFDEEFDEEFDEIYVAARVRLEEEFKAGNSGPAGRVVEMLLLDLQLEYKNGTLSPKMFYERVANELNTLDEELKDRVLVDSSRPENSNEKLHEILLNVKRDMDAHIQVSKVQDELENISINNVVPKMNKTLISIKNHNKGFFSPLINWMQPNRAARHKAIEEEATKILEITQNSNSSEGEIFKALLKASTLCDESATGGGRISKKLTSLKELSSGCLLSLVHLGNNAESHHNHLKNTEFSKLLHNIKSGFIPKCFTTQDAHNIDQTAVATTVSVMENMDKTMGMKRVSPRSRSNSQVASNVDEVVEVLDVDSSIQRRNDPRAKTQ